MIRRDALRSLALVPMAFIPGTKIVDVPQSTKSFIERAKYLDYTEKDFLRCSLLSLDEDGHKIWEVPVTKVTLTKQPLRVVMIAKTTAPRTLTIAKMRFVDKDRRMLFQPRRSACNVQRGDLLNLTYTIVLD